jgi:hypothetical protein
LLAAPSTARADVWDLGAATNDNSFQATRNELVHGLEQVHDLAARDGVPDEDYYVINEGLASFEAIVDSASADLGGIFSAANFVRLDADGVTIVQESTSTWGFGGTPGFSRALRWRQGNVAASFTSYLRVRSQCGAQCTSQDTYRIRFYDTTLSIPRFNNAGAQTTVLLIQNTTGDAVSGEIHFWYGVGPLLFELPFQIPRYGILVTNTASIPELQGQAGSVRITHDAGYGRLTGKAVGLEPATGFVFESALVSRPR